METENQQLKKANLKQAEQILILQDKLQSKYLIFILFDFFVLAYFGVHLAVSVSSS